MIDCQRDLFDIPEDVAYLNTAYMSPLMNSVVEAIDKGSRLKARPWTLKIDHFYQDVHIARSLFSELLKTTSQNVAIIPSASYGLQIAANNIKIDNGSKILVLENQFPSNVYPWRRAAKINNAQIVTITIPEQEAATQYILDQMDETVSVVAVPNILWTNGSLVGLKEISRKCREMDAELVLDLTQSAGAFYIDLTEIDPAFAITANYKWMLGPYTTGFLYVSSRYLEGTPLEEGWIQRKDSKDFANLVNYQDCYEDGAIRYDMGQRSNFALIPGVVAALKQIKKWGIKNIESTLYHQSISVSEKLKKLGLTVSEPKNRGPHFIGAKLPKGAPENILEALSIEKIYLSERGGSLRITPHLWNNNNDFDRLETVLSKLL
jgi:selenocysteine lyase/cysteine desulfurase|tara:strand:+ start:1249 stop:2382 length:1134 start_codon:yes stop_codon:yes gene_type:complete